MLNTRRALAQGSGYLRQSLHMVYLGLAWLLAGCITVQVFLAGSNVFGQPVWWGAHIQLGHATGVVLLALVLAGFAGRVPRRMRWLSLALLLLFAFQYNARLVAALVGVPQLVALHAVNALFLFSGAITLGRWAWQFKGNLRP